MNKLRQTIAGLLLICLTLVNLLSPTTALALYECEWTPLNNVYSPYHGRPAFCLGGFDTEAELKSGKVKFYCQSGCGVSWQSIGFAIGSGFTRWSALQEYPLSSVTEVGLDEKGKYFTCLTGDFDESVKEGAKAEIEDNYIGCKVGATAAAGVAVMLALSGAGIPLVPLFLVGAGVAGGGCALLIGTAKYEPTFAGEVVDTGGARLCKNTMTIKIDAQGNVAGTTPICNYVSDPAARNECILCQEKPGVYTPLGCIETNPQQFVAKLLQIAIGIAGGIAFLMIIYGGFLCMTSVGNPEKLNHCKEIIVSAISGLLLIVFSVLILRIIGVDILGIKQLVGG